MSRLMSPTWMTAPSNVTLFFSSAFLSLKWILDAMLSRLRRLSRYCHLRLRGMHRGEMLRFYYMCRCQHTRRLSAT